MRANRTALDNIKLMPRMLRDVSGQDLSITLFEKEHALPLIIGPTGPAGFVWYRGETELARAAAKSKYPFTVASTSNTPLEDIYKNGGGTQWYQLYVWQDIDASLVTVNRALDAGYEALVLTVDSPVYNNREIDVRNGMKFPPQSVPARHWMLCFTPGGSLAPWPNTILRRASYQLFQIFIFRTSKGPR